MDDGTPGSASPSLLGPWHQASISSLICSILMCCFTTGPKAIRLSTQHCPNLSPRRLLLFSGVCYSDRSDWYIPLRRFSESSHLALRWSNGEQVAQQSSYTGGGTRSFEINWPVQDLMLKPDGIAATNYLTEVFPSVSPRCGHWTLWRTGPSSGAAMVPREHGALRALSLFSHFCGRMIHFVGVNYSEGNGLLRNAELSG